MTPVYILDGIISFIHSFQDINDCLEVSKVLKSMQESDYSNKLTIQRNGIKLYEEESRIVLEQIKNDPSFCESSKRKNMILKRRLSNPFIFQNKSDIEIEAFILISSTKPLVAYFNDGLVNYKVNDVSIQMTYDEFTKMLLKEVI